jgi:hypothetical protein
MTTVYSQMVVRYTNVLLTGNALILSIRIQGRMSRFKKVFSESQSFLEGQSLLTFLFQFFKSLFNFQQCHESFYLWVDTAVVHVFPIARLSYMKQTFRYGQYLHIVGAFLYIPTSLIFGRYIWTLNYLAVVNEEQYSRGCYL